MSIVSPLDTEIRAALAPLRAAGFALHWLRPRGKAPIKDEWSEAPVLSEAELLASHYTGNNLGVRLGEPSQVAGGYLHVLDIDIRVADLRDEAWEALGELFPGLDLSELPCVQSGSGGESRHLYLITDKPFRSKKLRTSEGKHRHFDKKKGRDVWSYDWEIELFGTGKQVAMPPSVHPRTGRPYIWITPFDFALLDLGIGPFIPSAAIERLAVAAHEEMPFETREPLTFSSGQLERVLRDIPDERIDDYHDWVTLGQALHHQFGASDEGFELWLTHSARSTKFDPKDRRNLLRKWRGFGRNRRQPVTMASIVEWAKDARVAALRASFDEEDFDEEPAAPAEEITPKPSSSAALKPAAPAEEIDPFDAIGSDTPPPDEVDVGPSTGGAFDEILGGDDEDADDEVDDIDAIGSNRPVKGQSRAVSGDWISLLDINDTGAIKPTLHNVELIVTNDPRLVGLPQLNEFTQETVQRCAPGTKANRRRNAAKQTRQLQGAIWEVKDTVNGDIWSSARDYAIRSVIEAPGTQGGYGIKVSDRDLKAATVLAAWGHCFHPVREYLSGLTWDGRPRVESLFIDFLGAEDNRYYRDVARLMMVAGVARVFEPGCKWDTAVILEGLQGRGKSTFIRVLARRWFSELDGNFHDSKEMVEKMQGSWILEMPELNGFVRSEVQSIKAFISRQVDKVRLAYEARATDFPRQSILIGSTNDKEYLKDNTGGRRFLPVECRVEMIDIPRLRTVVDQLWAEAYALYRTMREAHASDDLPLYLSDPYSFEYAARLQESRRVESPDDVLAGRIEEWLDRPIATGAMDGDFSEDGTPLHHNEVCTVQVWVECLGGDHKTFTPQAQAQVNRAMGRVRGWAQNGDQKRFPKYGKQRVFYRGGEAGKLARLGLSSLV